MLRTTTWKNRHALKLSAAHDYAVKQGLVNPVILDYGPGGAIDFLLEYLPKSDRNSFRLFDHFRRFVFKHIESYLRKTGSCDLATSEPAEIYRVFSDLAPREFHVIDKEPAVLEAVKKLSRKEGLSSRIFCHEWDVEKGSSDISGDIVIAHKIIECVDYKSKVLENIAMTTRVGGIFSTTFENNLSGFERVDSNLYRRTS